MKARLKEKLREMAKEFGLDVRMFLLLSVFALGLAIASILFGLWAGLRISVM